MPDPGTRTPLTRHGSGEFRYTVYGLFVVSNRAVPGLTAHREPVPRNLLHLRLGEECPWAGSNAARRYTHSTVDEHGAPMVVCTEHSANRLALTYADGTRFHLDLEQRAIWATWQPPMTLEDTATYLLGPVLGFYLRFSGHICLHASAVVFGDRCLAFLGPPGSGKSTLAAAFATLGGPVLTEDVACLDEDGGHFSVRPGYPLVRLWDGSTGLLALGEDPLPLLTPNWTKRYLQLGSASRPFHDRSASLAAVLLLTDRRPMAGPCVIEELPGQGVLTQLVANTYGNYLLDRDMRAHEFQVLGRLAHAVPVRAIVLNADGSRLLEACDWIRRHAFA